jgi:hypothetical protein
MTMIGDDVDDDDDTGDERDDDDDIDDENMSIVDIIFISITSKVKNSSNLNTCMYVYNRVTGTCSVNCL